MQYEVSGLQVGCGGLWAGEAYVIDRGCLWCFLGSGERKERSRRGCFTGRRYFWFTARSCVSRTTFCRSKAPLLGDPGVCSPGGVEMVAHDSTYS
jgi:hypothetical protein